MNKFNKFSPEVRERAVRMVRDHRGESPPPSLWAAIEYTAPRIGWVSQTGTNGSSVIGHSSCGAVPKHERQRSTAAQTPKEETGVARRNARETQRDLGDLAEHGVRHLRQCLDRPARRRRPRATFAHMQYTRQARLRGQRGRSPASSTDRVPVSVASSSPVSQLLRAPLEAHSLSPNSSLCGRL